MKLIEITAVEDVVIKRSDAQARNRVTNAASGIMIVILTACQKGFW